MGIYERTQIMEGRKKLWKNKNKKVELSSLYKPNLWSDGLSSLT